ncbi:pentatricopeptide repeat-containing protein [Cucumis melo var. makuwa]|uniref:Pentatricopeptide repeat-containing protein n=1 Tax=Cucumis melo var. makuwa TaxID=1194695 RepID=A0A5A7TSH7_CUCMM|nr:pentatricopeptide repeat-containing protein [Cucumis melo var. makuwa]TYJ99474.1 pentatricopeptide repeat-containing protein [Cucumis melo var. makuwa]
MTEALSLSALVQKCTSVASLKAARQLHALILTSIATASSLSPYVCNNILSMYARCGAIWESQQVFEKMPQRNLVSFNALIAAYSRSHGHAPLAFNLLSQMELEFLRPNSFTITSLLQAASSLEDQFWSSLIHTQVVKCGFVHDVRVQTALIGTYSYCLDLESAGKVFRCTIDKDVVTWNTMIFGNLKHDKLNEALRLFNEMLGIGLIPTQFTYAMILNICCRNGDYLFGRLIHGRIITSNAIIDRTLQNVLLDLYCNCGDIHTAFCIFNSNENPDLVAWNTIISGCSENEEGEKAMKLFQQLKKSSLTKPDDYTYAAVISTIDNLLSGMSFIAQVIKDGFEGSVFISSVIVSMLFRNGESQAAARVFVTVAEKDVVLWTEMISGYSRIGEGEKAIKCFHQMRQNGHELDSFSLSLVLSSCADLATLKQGEIFHSLALKTGCEAEIYVLGSLINMYAKNGDLGSAQLIFSQVPCPDLKCWNSMLGGYSHHGNMEQALNLFFNLRNNGVKPDQVTFLSLLSACNHSNSVEIGQFLWNYMKECDIIPNSKHYSCMVSLLSGAGFIDEAEEMITKSPFANNDPELWRTLLSSCVVKKNLRVGVNAAKQVLRIDPEDSAAHILLSNLYAAAGKWDGVIEMRRRIREKLVGKDPGVSWIEAKTKIQSFSSGLQSHPEVDEALTTLLKLRGNMSEEMDESSGI